MSHTRALILDREGHPLLRCSRCNGPIGEEDIYAEGLRLPEHGETAADYFEAELIDELHHTDCPSSFRAGSSTWSN